MRITIESSQAITTISPTQASINEDVMNAGGPPSTSGPAHSGLTEPTAPPAEKAGSPPGWLLEAINQAFAENPGRFDAIADSPDSTLNGGTAPTLGS